MLIICLYTGKYLQYCYLTFINTFTIYSYVTWINFGAVEYTDSFSAEGQDPPNNRPGYDNKQSDGDVPVMQEFWGM